MSGKTGPPDNDLISLSDPKKILNWTKSLAITEEKLRATVNAVGNSADKVQGLGRNDFTH
jgi:hypothetical protein